MMAPLSRSTVGGLLLALGSFLALMGAGCGQIDGANEPFAGTVLYEDPQGDFSLRILQPPWLPALKYQGKTFFVVPPSDATISTDPLVILAEALYSLHVDAAGGAPPDAMQSIKSGLPVTSMARDRDVRTASGATGMELSWKEAEELFHRDAFLAGSGTPTFRLHFTARRDVGDDPMVGQMIASFDTR